MSFTVVIPARYGSTRFPGKPLANIKGRPMIQHVYERAIESGAESVIIATDDPRIGETAESFNAKVCYTASTHSSGTERIAEVIEKESIAAERIVVNVQGDEPFIPAQNIAQVAENLAQQPDLQMSTLCFPIDNKKEIENPNVVKVVFDHAGKAMYFSRAPIPYDRSWVNNTQNMQAAYYRHIGIYAYRAKFVGEYLGLPVSQYEQIESLEQLRVLYSGYGIHVDLACEAPPHGVDTPEDLAKLNAL